MRTKMRLELRLRELRENHGLSTNQMSRILNVNEGTIVNWENNDNLPPIRKLVQIAEYFHCSTDYVLGISDDWGDAPNVVYENTNTSSSSKKVLNSPEEEYEEEDEEEDDEDEEYYNNQSSTGKNVFLTILGTIIFFGLAYFIIKFLI